MRNCPELKLRLSAVSRRGGLAEGCSFYMVPSPGLQAGPLRRYGAKRYEARVPAGRVLLHVSRARAVNHAVNAHATERRPDPRRARVTKMLAMEELARAAPASGERAQGGAAGH